MKLSVGLLCTLPLCVLRGAPGEDLLVIMYVAWLLVTSKKCTKEGFYVICRLFFAASRRAPREDGIHNLIV